VRPECDQVCST